MKKVNCKVCNKEQNVSPSRFISYKTCSHKCLSELKKSQNKPNTSCSFCKKPYYLKPSVIAKNKKYTCCSKECMSELKKEIYKGRNNPNYRGKQYDSSGYRINHYPKVGRMKEHHYVAFNILNIDKLPKGHVIHHRDCNIYNNSPENLALLTESEHRWLHKQFGNATLWAFMNNKISYEELENWSNDKEKCQLLKKCILN